MSLCNSWGFLNFKHITLKWYILLEMNTVDLKHWVWSLIQQEQFTLNSPGMLEFSGVPLYPWWKRDQIFICTTVGSTIVWLMNKQLGHPLIPVGVYTHTHTHTHTHTQSKIPLCVWTNRGWKARQQLNRETCLATFVQLQQHVHIYLKSWHVTLCPAPTVWMQITTRLWTS